MNWEVVWKDFWTSSGVTHNGMQLNIWKVCVCVCARGCVHLVWCIESSQYPWKVIRRISAWERFEFHGQFSDWSTQLLLLQLFRDKRTWLKECDWEKYMKSCRWEISFPWERKLCSEEIFMTKEVIASQCHLHQIEDRYIGCVMCLKQSL